MTACLYNVWGEIRFTFVLIIVGYISITNTYRQAPFKTEKTAKHHKISFQKLLYLTVIFTPIISIADYTIVW